MKKLVFALIFFLGAFFITASAVEARVSVRGYSRRTTGTYVFPHFRSSPNYSRYDNWSSWGNYNPYTGKKGYKSWW